MDITKRLDKLTYMVEHNPNCKLPFLVRLVGKDSARIDKKPEKDTKDILGFGKTLVEAAKNALNKKQETKGG
jgi:hypothetical protein